MLFFLICFKKTLVLFLCWYFFLKKNYLSVKGKKNPSLAPLAKEGQGVLFPSLFSGGLLFVSFRSYRCFQLPTSIVAR